MLHFTNKNIKSSTFKNKDSLTRKTLFQITISATLIVATTTIINYRQVLSTLRYQKIIQLEEYVIQRVAREQEIFELATDNHATLKSEVIGQIQRSNSLNLEEQFNNLFVRYPDGVIRNRLENFNGERQAGVYMDKSLSITPEIRRQVIDLKGLIEAYGRAWHNRFQSTFIMTPDNIVVVYWPEVPNYVQEADANFYIPESEEYLVATPQNNPQRKTVWTEPYYEEVSRLWLVSASTPVDVNGQPVLTIGHDIRLNQLIERTVNSNIEGGYNLIFTENGKLIAHPDLMDRIQDGNISANINNFDDMNLVNIFQAVINYSENQIIIENSKDEQYLAVKKIAGPDWYFVTVYPQSLLKQDAAGIAISNFLMGFILLFLLIMVVFIIMSKQVSVPLKQLINATKQISEGDYNIAIPDNRQDELGTLARSFNLMAAEISARSRELQMTLKNQNILVNQVTITMNELSASSKTSAEQAFNAAVGAKQVLSLIKGNTENSQINSTYGLQKSVEKLSQNIRNLNKKINKIGLISAVVSNLANQTNILALNAAVEAVRSDKSSGQGFDVIANEIRKLADQSKSSATEINNLVDDIQKAMISTVRVTEESQAAFNEVVDSINGIVENSQTISLNISQQSSAIEQVFETMNNLNKMAIKHIKN